VPGFPLPGPGKKYPSCDLVATTAYPDLERKLSMRMGKEYWIDRIGKTELEGFARDIGVKPRVVFEIGASLVASISGEWETSASFPELADHADLIGRMRTDFEERARNIAALQIEGIPSRDSPVCIAQGENGSSSRDLPPGLDPESCIIRVFVSTEHSFRA
jgi:hypothetical protein